MQWVFKHSDDMWDTWAGLLLVLVLVSGSYQDSNWTQQVDWQPWRKTMKDTLAYLHPLLSIWSGQLNAKSWNTQSCRSRRFVTINSWKVHLGFLECWSNNELAQSFCVGFSFFNLERVPEADYIGKVTIISWKMGADCRHAGLPEVLDLFNSERLHSE